MGINKKFYKAIIFLSLIIIFTLGLYLRLKFVYGPQMKLSPDAINYDIMVKQFLTKGFLAYRETVPNAYVVPGYPVFLSFIYWIFGYSPDSPFTMVRIVQAFISSASILLVFLIGREVINNRVGVISALFFSLYLPFIQSVTLILTEVLYTFFFLLYILLQIKALKSYNSVLHVLSGIVFALAILIRPGIFPLFAFPYIYMFIISKDKKIIKEFAFFTLAITLTMLPWWIRNYLTLGKVIILSTGSGNPLFAGTFPYLDYSNMKYVPPQEQFKEGIRLIIQGFTTNTLVYLKWFTIGKFFYIFSKPWYFSTSLQTLAYLHHIVVVLGFIGLLFAVHSKQIRLLALFVVLLILLQLMFIPEARYAYPIMPLLMILSAYIIEYLFFTKKSIETAAT